MASFIFLGLLGPALFLLMIAWAISTIVSAVTLPKRAAKVPSCERCRYPVAGLGAFNCPECGTDLRVTGIITRTMEVRRRGNLFSAILAWTVLCAMAGVVAAWVFGSIWMFSTMRNSGNATTMATTTTFAPASGTSKGIAVAVKVVTPLASVTTPTTTVTATIQSNDGRTFTANASSAPSFAAGSVASPTAKSSTASTLVWTWTKEDGSEASVTTLDGQSVLEWYGRVGIPEGPTANAEAVELAQSIAAAVATPGASVASTELFAVSSTKPVVTGLGPNLFAGSDPYAMTAVAVAIVGVLAWGVGIWLIVNRRKRMLKAVGA